MPQENKTPKIFWVILSAFLLVPIIVSVVSTIHVINFFELSNWYGLALTLAIAFEIGALSALAGLVALDKINKNVVYSIFFLLTLYQVMGNTYFAYDFISNKMLTNPDLIKNWTELFGFSTDPEDTITVKRVIAIISGAILPIVSLCFLDLSVDYIQKSTGIKLNKIVGKDKEEANNEVINNEIPFNKEVRTVEDQIIEPEPIVEPESPVELPPVEEKKTEVIEVLPTLPETNQENDDFEDDNFDTFLGEKKKRLESLKAPYLKLLMLLYKGGELIEGSELPGYNEYLDMIPKDEFSQKDIKQFLILCNYLGIFKVVETQKIALKSYGDAINKLNGYLSWN